MSLLGTWQLAIQWRGSEVQPLYITELKLLLLYGLNNKSNAHMSTH